jgi:MFS transporter, PPP family, 3-phenylpropionic acid transporter
MPKALQMPRDVKPDGFELRLSVLFGMMFVPNAVHLAFFPLWLQETGFSAVEISALLTAPVVMRLIATLPVTYLADRSPERAYVVITSAALAFIFSLFLFADLRFAGLLALMCALSASWSPQVPLADSIAVSGVRRFGTYYASTRVWGSITFLAMSVAAGFIVERYGSRSVPVMIAGGFFAILVASFFTPRLGRKRQLSGDGLLPSADKSLRRPAVLIFLLATGLIQGSHGFLYSFGSIYWKDNGITAELVGMLWAVQVLAEIVLFKAYGRMFGRVRPETVLMISGVLVVFRWVLTPFFGVWGFGFAGFALLQCVHAFSFGATYLAQQSYLAHAVPEGQAGSAQGLAVFIHGLVLSVTMLAAGPIYDAVKGYGFIVMSFVAIAGILLSYRFASLHAREAGSEG